MELQEITIEEVAPDDEYLVRYSGNRFGNDTWQVSLGWYLIKFSGKSKADIAVFGPLRKRAIFADN